MQPAGVMGPRLRILGRAMSTTDNWDLELRERHCCHALVLKVSADIARLREGGKVVLCPGVMRLMIEGRAAEIALEGLFPNVTKASRSKI
jgi:hypothetical protein